MKREIKGLLASLDNSEGVVLRYIVSTTDQPVSPTRLINSIDWSPLPKSYLDAKRILDLLLERQLIRKQTKQAYTYTSKGQELIEYADKKHLWQKPIGEGKITSRRNLPK